jgi:hypothetical protein
MALIIIFISIKLNIMTFSISKLKVIKRFSTTILSMRILSRLKLGVQVKIVLPYMSKDYPLF